VFAEAWEVAIEEGSENLLANLEASAYQRAVEGVPRDRYDAAGNLVESWTEYSDRLLIQLLKTYIPKYRSTSQETAAAPFVPLDQLLSKHRAKNNKQGPTHEMATSTLVSP